MENWIDPWDLPVNLSYTSFQSLVNTISKTLMILKHISHLLSNLDGQVRLWSDKNSNDRIVNTYKIAVTDLVKGFYAKKHRTPNKGKKPGSATKLKKTTQAQFAINLKSRKSLTLPFGMSFASASKEVDLIDLTFTPYTK